MSRPLFDPLYLIAFAALPAIALLAAADPLVALAGLAAATGAALLAWTTTRRVPLALAALALALLFLPPDPVMVLLAATLLFLLAVTAATGIPWLLLAAAPAFAVPDPAGPWLAVAALALSLATPGPSETPTAADRVRPILAAFLLVTGAYWSPVAAAVGLVAGLLGRLVVVHPARPRLAASLGRAGLWGGILPAALLVLVAALGKVPELGPRALLAVGWAAVALGGLAAVLVLGLEVSLRAPPPAAARAVALPLAAFGLPFAVLLTGELTAGIRLAGLAWAVVAPAAALGLHRLVRATGRGGVLVAGAALVAALASLPVRLLL